MRKFLSYILTFVSLFVISAVVTIRAKSDLLTTAPPTTSAGASGQTTLLGGIMESLNASPKLDISGDININVEEQEIGVSINANVDLTTLTNPKVMGSVSLNINNQTYDILLTYTQTDIYLACGDMSVQAKVSDLTQVVGLLATVVDADFSLPNIQMPQIDLDSLMAALSNPVKMVVDGKNFYQITLPDIAKVTIVCDDNFNIQNVSIDELYIIKDAQIDCNLNINADENIEVTAPSNNASYLDVKKLVESFIQLKDKDIINVHGWTSLFKSKLFYQRIDTVAYLSIPTNRYNVENTLHGNIEGDLNVKYLNDTIYAKFNQIGIKAGLQDIQQLADLFTNNNAPADQTVTVQSSTLVNDIMNWFKNNYQSLLDKAVVASNQIVLSADLNGILGQTGVVRFVLRLTDNQIYGIRISGIKLGDYSLDTSFTITDRTKEKFDVNTNEYYDINNITQIIKWASNLNTLDINADLQLTTNNTTTPLQLNAKVDLLNNAQQLSTNLFGLPVNIAHQNGVVYANVNDIYLSVNNNTIGALLAKLLPQDTDAKLNAVKNIISNLSINEILSLVNISTTTNTINIVADLSSFVGNNLVIDLSLVLDNGVQLTINKIEYNDILLTGIVGVENINEQVTVENTSNYLSVENFVEYLDNFMASKNYTVSGEVDFSTSIINQKFVGDISLDFENISLKVQGKLVGKINADIKVVYLNNTAYVTYNKQYFKLSKQQAEALLQRFNINITPIFNKIDEVVNIKEGLSVNNLVAGLLINGTAAQVAELPVPVQDIVTIIKGVQINSNSISLDAIFNSLNINALLTLNSSLSVNANVVYNDYNINANVTISTTPADYTVNAGYIDLDLLVPQAIAVLNTIECNNYIGTALVKWGEGADQSLALNYNINFNTENMQLQASLSTTYKGLHINVAFVDNIIYLNVADIYVNVTLEQLMGFVNMLFEDQINNINQSIQQIKNTTTEDLLQTLYNVTSAQPLIKELTSNGTTANITLFNDLTIALSSADKLTGLAVGYNNIYVETNFNATKAESSVVVENPTSYLNVVDFVDYANAFVTSKDLTISGKVALDTTNFTQSFIGDISVNFENTSIKIDGNLVGKVNAYIQVVYSNDIAYLTYNKQYFKLSKKQLNTLLAQFNIDITPIFNEVDNIVEVKNNLDIKQVLAGILVGNNIKDLSVQDVNLQQVINLINTISVNSSNIRLNNNFAGVGVNVTLGLKSSLSVNASVVYNDYNINANVIIGTTPADYTINAGYIDLDLLVPQAIAVLNTIECNNYIGTALVKWGEGADQSLALNYNINFNTENMQLQASLSTTYKGLNINVAFVDNIIYLNVADIYVNVTLEQLMGFVNMLFEDQINNINQSIQQIKNTTTEDLLQTLYNVTSAQPLIKELTSNGATANITLFNDLTIALSSADKLTGLAVGYNNIYVETNFNATKAESSVVVENPTSYLNVVDFVDYANAFVTSKDLTISGEVALDTANFTQSFVGNISVNFENANIKVSGCLVGKINANINIVYVNEKVYLTYNSQNFVVSKNQLATILLDFGVDITPVLNTIDKIVETKNNFNLNTALLGVLQQALVQSANTEATDTPINVEQIINVVKEIAVTNTYIRANLQPVGLNAGLALYLNKDLGVQASVEYNGYNVVADLIISTTPADYSVSQNYINLDQASSTVSSVINTIKDTQFNGTINFAWGSAEDQQVSATYNISLIDNKLYGTLVVTYIKQSVTIYILDSTVYLNIKGIYIKATITEIKDILDAEMPAQTQQQIQDIITKIQETTGDDILQKVEDITNQTLVENLELNNNELTLVVKGVKAKITTNNNKISQINVEYNNYVATITINSSTNISIPQIDETNYQSITDVYMLVKNVYNYAVGGEYYFNINTSLFGYTINGYVGYNNGLVAQLTTRVLNKQLDVTIVNNIVYINFDGFIASISFADIPELVAQVNTQFNLSLSQEALDIIDWLFNENTVVNIQQTIDSITGETEIDYLQIINDISINLYSDNLVVSYKDINAIINFANNMLTSVNVQYVLDAQTNDNITATLILCDNKQVQVPSAGLNLSSAIGLLKDIAEYVNNTNYQGSFNLDTEIIDLTGTYKIVLNNGELSAQISTSFYNLPIEITIVNNMAYVAVDQLKIYLPLNEISNLINWINTSFNTNINSNLNISTKLSELSSLAGDISLEDINFAQLLVDIVNNVVSVNYNNLQAIITLAQTSSATLTINNNVIITLGLQTANNTISAPTQEYLHYTELTNIVDSALDLYNGKKMSARAEGSVYEGTKLHYTADCNIQIDLENLLFYANVQVTDHFKNTTTSVMLAYTNNYWYVDYNELKIKIVKEDLTEILAMLLQVVGIDPSLLPFLEGVTGGLNVDVSTLTHLVPKLDFGDPLSLIDVFEQLVFAKDRLHLVIDNSLISDNLNVDNMTATLTTQSGKLNSIQLANLYTGITDYEKLDFTLTMQDFTSVTQPHQGKYIDISGTNELIKALINTSELTHFEIQTTVKLDMILTLIGVDNHIDWDIPLNVKIRLDENKKPEMMISLGSIPSVVFVNNDVPYVYGDVESGETRMWYIYYKDGYIYMLREDRIDYFRIYEAGTRTYQKRLKVHVESFFSDFFYYLKWGIGFTDTIMNAIEDALALSDNYTPNLGNVINDFKCNDATNFTVDLNLQEISNNPQVKNVVVDLGVVNNQETAYKNYLGTAELHLYMPISKGTFEINLISEDIKLVNIGKTFDFSAFENFVYYYDGKEGTEYDRTWDDGRSQTSWGVSAERVYTIMFEEQGGQAVSDITGKAGDAITLPTLANKVIVDTSVGMRYTYKFGGWYTTELCNNGTQFNSSTMPRSDKVLYAKWVLIAEEKVVTISFNSNGGTALESISGYQGASADVSNKYPTKESTWVDKGYIWYKGQWEYEYTHYTFDGWYTDSACTQRFNGYFPDKNITLYAKWKTSTETKYLYNWDRP